MRKACQANPLLSGVPLGNVVLPLLFSAVAQIEHQPEATDRERAHTCLLTGAQCVRF